MSMCLVNLDQEGNITPNHCHLLDFYPLQKTNKHDNSMQGLKVMRANKGKTDGSTGTLLF